MKNDKRLDAQVYEEMAARMTSPKEFVDGLIREQLAWDSFSTQRLVEGVGNEVYRIDSPANDSVILRIHHGEHPGFTHEKWAMEQVTATGVPVPTVLALGTSQCDGKKVTYSIQTLLDGVPLSALLDKGLSENEIQHYADRAGAMLARIHQVKTIGYGHFTTESGRGPSDSLVDEMEQHKDYDTLKAAIADTSLSLSELDAIVEEIDKIETDEEPHLVHVDYAPKHIFVKDGEIVGIIDWEIVLSGITATDFNRWRSQDNRIPMMALLEGYEKVRAIPASFWSTFLIVQMHSALRTVLYHYNISHSDVDRKKAAEEARALLQSGKPILT